MKTPVLLLAAALTLGLATFEVDAAKRFGGGGNLGKQSTTPAMKEAPKSAPGAPADAAKAAPAAPAATPAAPAPQPSFMSRWGGMLAGLGIGALLGSMFSGGLGGLGAGLGILLMLLVVVAIAFMIIRALGSRNKPEAKPVAFAGIGQNVPAPAGIEFSSAAPAAAQPVRAESSIPADFQVEPFLRQAKMAFIRLQAANDAKDLDDIRDYTTPEMYAEISLQLEERGDAPQKTEVVNVHPTLLEVVNEGGFEIASVRFAGLIRETVDGNPEPFDEVWHVRKKIGDRNSAWLIAGIQQFPQ
jgi:predicted lipid-binding transport protein (Tim44 family)